MSIATFATCGIVGRRSRLAIMEGDVRSRRQADPPPRPYLGRAAALRLGVFGLGYAIVEISTQKPDNNIVHIAGISEAQEIFGGVPQEGDRLGSNDAPVSIQVFNDLQCASCREAFLSTIPALTEDYARPGDAKLLWRHYSNAENAEELGFYGAEAAAEQGYGWQYIYLFFRNQDEAKRVGIDQDFLDSVGGGVEELTAPNGKRRWKRGPRRAARSPSGSKLRGTGPRPRDPYRPGDDRQRPERDADPAGQSEAGRSRSGDRRSAVGGWGSGVERGRDGGRRGFGGLPGGVG